MWMIYSYFVMKISRKCRKELTPAQFVERCEPMFRRWSEQADSLVAANRYVGRAARLVRNTARISQGYRCSTLL